MPIILNGQTNDVTINGVSVATDNEVSSAVSAGTSGKQDTLVSGTSIKTINGTSLLGSGNMVLATTVPAASQTVIGGAKMWIASGSLYITTT